MLMPDEDTSAGYTAKKKGGGPKKRATKRSKPRPSKRR
jgi:hypothetical protein